MAERRVVSERSARRGPGGLDPAVGVFVALLVLALIALLVWYFAVRGDDNDSSNNNPNPNPGTSQQQDTNTNNNQPTEQPSATTSP